MEKQEKLQAIGEKIQKLLQEYEEIEKATRECLLDISTTRANESDGLNSNLEIAAIIQGIERYNRINESDYEKIKEILKKYLLNQTF